MGRAMHVQMCVQREITRRDKDIFFIVLRVFPHAASHIANVEGERK